MWGEKEGEGRGYVVSLSDCSCSESNVMPLHPWFNIVVRVLTRAHTHTHARVRARARAHTHTHTHTNTLVLIEGKSLIGMCQL